MKSTMRPKERVLSILLTVCLLVGVLPADTLGGVLKVQATENTVVTDSTEAPETVQPDVSETPDALETAQPDVSETPTVPTQATEPVQEPESSYVGEQMSSMLFTARDAGDGEYSLDVTTAGNAVTDTAKGWGALDSKGYYTLGTSGTESNPIMQSNGIFGYYTTGSKVKIPESGGYIQLDGAINGGGNGQASILTDLSSFTDEKYHVELKYTAKGNATKVKSGLVGQTQSEVGSQNSSTTDEVTYITTWDGGSKYLIGADQGMRVYSLKVAKAEDIILTGTVTCSKALPADGKAVFKEVKGVDADGKKTYGAEYEGNVDASNGTYSVTIPASSIAISYEVSFSDVEYVMSPIEIDVTKDMADKTVNMTVTKAAVYTLSGSYASILGDKKAEVSALVFTAVTNSDYEVPEATLDKTNGTYSVNLEKGTTYKVTAKGVEDYNITTADFSYDSDANLDLTFVEKPRYPIAINLGSTPDLSGKNVTYVFTQIGEGGKEYKYEFADKSNVTLRDGTYQVSLGGDFEKLAYKIARGSSLTVNGSNTTLNITFDPVTSWGLSTASFQKADGTYATEVNGTTGYYQGLYIDASTAKLAARPANGDAQFNSGAIIKVPVTGKCTVSVTVSGAGNQYALYTIGGTPADISKATSSYEYTADTAGTVDIVSTGNAYIASIAVIYPAKEVQFVEQTVMPFVAEDDADANTALDTDGNPRASKKDSLLAQPEGQKLKLTQNGGNFNQTYSLIQDVGYYLFPMTADKNTLEFDVMITGNSGTSDPHGFFAGMFTNNYVYSLGLRKGGVNVRGVYSKNGTVTGGGQYAGAGSPDGTIPLNTSIHYVIKYDGEKPKVTATYLLDGKVKTDEWSQGKVAETEDKVYYGFAVSQVSATVTNMRYTAADGTVLYDQNACYYPEGSIPVVTAGSVTAVAASSREYIDVSWEGTLPENDGTYVVEMQKDGGEWVELSADVTDMTYRYVMPAGEGGSYLFRVCGQLGKQSLGGGRNDYVTMTTTVSVLGALERPIVDIAASASQISLDWQDVPGAEYYEVYRYSFDEGEANSAKIAQVTDSAYADADVTAEVPYYYNVKAVSDTASNASPLSETVWQVATAGHSGTYVYESEAADIVLTKKSYDTVFDGKVVLEGIVDGVGTLEAYVNGSVAASAEIPTARESFSFELTVEQGRNDVELIFTAANGKKTRKAYNFVYLTNYDYIVDASFTGTDGQADTANGNDKPVYKTVQAAVNAATSGGIIFVKAGSYEERLTVNTPNISIIGEDREMTSIHCYPAYLGDKYEAGGDMDKRCATYIQSGATGFSAENITFANDYVYGTPDGKSNKSADAIRCEADQASFVNVKFVGVQDTLYMHTGKQYYNKCRIEGLVDFIYSGDGARAFFNDCEIVFVYESTKTAGYVAAPKTAEAATYGLTFNNCVILGEEGCSGTEYLLARPWGPDAYITWINCYMGRTVNANAPYGAMSGNQPEDARFYEFGTYGPAFAINTARRQISPSKAAEMISDAYLGWSPSTVSGAVGASYVGSITTTKDPSFVEQEYVPGTHVWASGDDTGLAMYNQEGYAQAYGVSGGGLLLETNENYYKVGNAKEFLDALVAVKAGGKNSVIELTDDIALGCNEVENFASYSAVIKAYNAQALTHPKLIESGVSILSFEKLHNLTIFSQNGSSILHANITMKNASNIMIRNIKFDELWEWDEVTAGDYDRNDWDYMTIDQGCDGIWIDHCTFYKAYDGVIDVKNPNPLERVTISWCEFLPGSENDTFFDEMMNYIYANPSEFPQTYQHLKEGGMTDEQIRWYAYGQKKTHLFGQDDKATNAAGIRVTLANNYYKNSMDRMPRLRYGDSHVYNCIMDSQDLLNAKYTIANEEVNKKIVSNGAASTCGAQVLLENCYISGIQNALNSGNGSSPKGYIGAVDSVYYMNGKATALEPKCNSSAYPAGEPALIIDADAFRAALPYSEYHLYNAKALDQILLPGSGAGKLTLTVLQWEKTSYNAEYVEPEVTIPDDDDDDDDNNGGGGSADDAEFIVNVDWDAVIDAINTAEKTKKPQNVDVTSGDRFEVPVNVLNKLVGTKVTLALHAGGDLTFSISGSDIKRTKASFKMAVSRARVIPSDVENQVLASALAYKRFSMEDKSAYPFIVNVHANMGAENAGKMAYLYYYDEKSGSMKLSGSFRVTSTGQVMFPLNRGDEYIIVVAGGPVTMGGKYIVVKGDNLSYIAKKVGTTLRKLIAANPQIKNVNLIFPGQEINIP